MNRCIHSWLVAAALLMCPCYALADPLTLATEDYPPFNYKVGESLPITGMSTDTLVEMAKRANVEMVPTMVPWARALAMAEKEKNTCVYSTIRTPERESRYKWIGPLISDNLALFARADADITLKSLDDARPYRIGTYNGSLANALLSAQGIGFEVAPNDLSNLSKLAAKRIDLWVASQKAGLFAAKRAGIVAVKPVLVIGDAKLFEMYLACNKQLPNATVALLNNILKKMWSDGTLDKIRVRYE